MKPIIGIAPQYDSIKKATFVTHSYKKAIKKCGGTPLELNYHEDVSSQVEKCDGILFCGGEDINPNIYGEEVTYSVNVKNERDNFEIKLFNVAKANKKPIFAICRGFQLINALSGGTLYQDLSKEYSANVCHNLSENDKHTVQVIKGTPLYAVTSRSELKVNSLHHQGIKTLGNGLIVNALSEDLVESYSMENYPYLLAVQWHPEKMAQRCAIQQSILKSFVKASKKNRK